MGPCLELVDTSNEFQRYLHIVQNGDSVLDLREGDDNWPGSFKPTRKYQERILTRDNPSVPAPTRPHTPQSPGAPPPSSSPTYSLRGSTTAQTEGKP
ncbi:hypothetical protein VTN00DRAFT_6136 [Thermoascus crustaceus]|uniref:uncharacterized protein n=1 Tax=Thermoascus crustaceus TaxID=5088 RepID=UPI00374312E5